MNELTEKETKVLEACRKYISENKISPSIRELMEMTGVTSTSVMIYYLHRLDEKGFITRSKIKARSIVLVEHQSGFMAAKGIIPWKEGDELPEDKIRRLRDQEGE